MATNANRSASLGIYLERSRDESIRVGTLARDQAGHVTFSVDESYLQLGHQRPILSSRWNFPGDEEQTLTQLLDRTDKVAHAGFLPSWFANLLPEGALLELVERQLGPGRHDDFDVISHLGSDLPGAVVARDETASTAASFQREQIGPLPDAPPRVRFSLAGIQLKFSMTLSKDKLTIPARNELGDIVAKLPNRRFPGLPEAEFTSMKLAAAAGVEVAGVHLLPTTSVEGLPSEFLSIGKHLLAVERFDRAQNRRIHMEDFAQIIGAVGDRKYTMSNEETNLRMVKRFCADPIGSVLEAVRRIVVNILLGNHDAHLKNWSLLYLDPVRPTLAPAYDIVPTYAFIPDEMMALQFGGTRTSSLITFRKFERAASYLEVDSRALIREAQNTVKRAVDAWPPVIREMAHSGPVLEVLKHRWPRLALTEGQPNPFGVLARRQAKSA